MNYMYFSSEYGYPVHETGAQLTGIIVHVVSLLLLCFTGEMKMAGIGLATILGHFSRLVYLIVVHYYVEEWNAADKRRKWFDLDLKENAVVHLKHSFKSVLYTISNYWMIDFILLFAVILSPHVIQKTIMKDYQI